MINNKYKIEEIINSGTFGTVYKCKYNNNLYAIKEESDIKALTYEANIYKQIKGVSNVASIKDIFCWYNKCYIVLDYYKYTLKDYKRIYYTSLNYYKELKRIFTAIIIALKNIHDKCIVHRDLKPNNICIDENFKPYIIDFGLSKQIIILSKHLSERKIKNVIGSFNFASLNTINLIEPSRRDDLESVIYIYIYVIK